ncbi:MAG: 6-bladed beta-propeller [Gammaproteobacteria bacterium]|nr:6-bladed beta-propeller [Gammaproteobacteria bacterium]MDH5800048.1 6-bladed beta-propeller [Gammaproteobacteria bacterium]
MFGIKKSALTVYVFACFLVLSGCSVISETGQRGVKTVFYPPLPNEPRIQLLTTINAALVQGKTKNAFSDFVLGKEDGVESRLTKPYGVAYFSNQVIVVDTRGPGYMILDANDKVLKTVRGMGPGRMQKPINVTVDREGRRYISDTGRGQVMVFDQQDEFLQAYGKLEQFKPSDALVVDGEIYISDLEHHIVHVLDLNSGVTRRTIGARGSGAGELFFPTNMALMPNNNILVSDTGNYRLQEFTLDGRFVRSYGQAGNGLGQFARPKGIAVDHEGLIYAIDSAFENIQLFDRHGQLLMFFGKPGNELDNINLPADISISYDGVQSFEQYADPNFRLQYLVFVTSQYGPNKITVYGFGEYRRNL